MPFNVAIHLVKYCLSVLLHRLDAGEPRTIHHRTSWNTCKAKAVLMLHGPAATHHCVIPSSCLRAAAMLVNGRVKSCHGVRSQAKSRTKLDVIPRISTAYVLLRAFYPGKPVRVSAKHIAMRPGHDCIALVLVRSDPRCSAPVLFWQGRARQRNTQEHGPDLVGTLRTTSRNSSSLLWQSRCVVGSSLDMRLRVARG